MNLQELSTNIAVQLTNVTGERWERSTRFDAEDTNWRAELTSGDKRLFISNTWAGRGRVYVGGSFPEGSSNYQPTERPSITVAETKEPLQIANDIKRRLLPEYVTLLAIVVKRQAEANDFAARTASLREQVARVVDGRVSGELVYSGNWDLQVSGPDSIRVQGHCNYLTLEQLRKIAQVCPELFRKAGQ